MRLIIKKILIVKENNKKKIVKSLIIKTDQFNSYPLFPLFPN